MAALRALTYSPFIEVGRLEAKEGQPGRRINSASQSECGLPSRLDVVVVGADGNDDVEVQGDEDDRHETAAPVLTTCMLAGQADAHFLAAQKSLRTISFTLQSSEGCNANVLVRTAAASHRTSGSC